MAHRRRLPFPPLTFFTPLSLVPRAAAHAPAVCKFLSSSPPPLLPLSPPSLPPSWTSPPHLFPLSSSFRSLSLAPRCARHASCRFVRVCGAQQLSLFPPSPFPHLLLLFLLVFSFPFTSRYLQCASLEQRARSRVARCNTLRFSFFFAKERKEAASAQSACALCSCHMRTARVASGTRAQRGKEGMQGERSESCLLRKSKEKKRRGRKGGERERGCAPRGALITRQGRA